MSSLVELVLLSTELHEFLAPITMETMLRFESFPITGSVDE